MQNIFVVTHTQSHHHIEGRVGGWYDTGLTELGRQQAGAVAARLETLVSGADTYLVSSDLMRASETAGVIGARLGVPVSLDKGFRENTYGEADGKPQAWLDKRMTVAPEHDRLDHIVVNQAESKRAFITRIYEAMTRLPDASEIIIVTHGYALTFVVANWIGLRLSDAGHVNFAASPGGITHLKQDDFFRNKAVMTLNDVSHLPGTVD